jgi:hypothetical protein
MEIEWSERSSGSIHIKNRVRNRRKGSGTEFNTSSHETLSIHAMPEFSLLSTKSNIRPHRDVIPMRNCLLYISEFAMAAITVRFSWVIAISLDMRFVYFTGIKEGWHSVW